MESKANMKQERREKRMYNNLINVIASFETREAKLYWIKALNVCDSIKGYLLYYFNLI